MSPEKIAIAVAVTIAAIAGIGAMKKVTGTSSAVAIVAVSPGTAPTNRPNSDAPSITSDVVRLEDHARTPAADGVAHASVRHQATRLQHAPGQRHPQQLVEREVDDQRQRRSRPARRRAGARAAPSNSAAR